MPGNNRENLKEVKLVISVVLGILILLATLFVSYRNSQKQPSDLVLPAGSTYLGPTPTPK